MAQGARYAGVAAPGGGFIDLVRGVASVPTNATFTTVATAIIGNAVNSSTSTAYNSVSNPYADTPTGMTFAAISIPLNSNATEVLFSTKNTTIGASGLSWSSAGTFRWFANGTLNTPTMGAAYVLNHPYFLACSIKNGQQYAVLTDLATGKTTTGTSTVAATLTVGTGPFGVGGTSQANVAADSKIAAVAYSINFLDLNQLIQWAQAPWDYWYPPNVGSVLFSPVWVAPPSGSGQQARAMVLA
jgi:hypothetical protein